MAPLRACVISQRAFPGDVRLEAQVTALRSAGLEVDVLCACRRGEPRRARSGAVGVRRLPSLERRRAGVARYLAEYASFFVSAAVTLAARHAWRRYALVLVTNLPDPLVWSAAARRALGARVLFDVRECTPEMLEDRFGAAPGGRASALMARIEQAAIGWADATLTCTEPMRRALVARGADRARVSVVLNVAAGRLPRRPAPADDDGFRVVTHGSVLPRYGHEVLLHAMARLADEVPGVHLEVMGDGPGRRPLERLVGELGLEDRVELCGWVERDELLRRLGRASCGVVPLPGGPEGDLAHTYKMFEYLDLGLPVVASRTTAVAEYFDDEEIVQVAPGDPEELAAALAALARDPARRARIGRAGAAAFERYGPSHQRERLLDVLDELLERDSG